MSEVSFVGLNEIRFQGNALSMVRLGNDQIWPKGPTGYTIISPPLPGNGFQGNGHLDNPTSATITRGSRKFQLPRSQFDVYLEGYDQPVPKLTFPVGLGAMQVGDIVDATFYHEYFPFAPSLNIKFVIT